MNKNLRAFDMLIIYLDSLVLRQFCFSQISRSLIFQLCCTVLIILNYQVEPHSQTSPTSRRLIVYIVTRISLFFSAV